MKKMTLDEYKSLATTFVSKEDSEARVAAHHTRIGNAIKQWEAIIACPELKTRVYTIPAARRWLNRELGIEETPRKVKEVVAPISTTHVISFLGTRYGENAPTKLSPTKPWSDEFLPLLELRTKCCAYFDDDRLVDVNLHSKLDFTVPSWMTQEKFSEITMCFFTHAGGSLEWSETAYNRLNKLSFVNRYAVCKLVNSNPRVPKRQELKNLFRAWMEGADCLGPYDFDKIRNQFIDLDAKRAEHGAYWDR